MPEVITENQTETKAAETEALAVVKQAEAIAVTDDKTCLEAGEFLKAIKTATNKVKAVYKPMKEQTHKAWRTVCDSENGMIEPLEKAEAYLKGQLSQYTLKVEQEREAERKRLEEIAQREMEDATLDAAAAAEEAGRPDVAEELLNQGTQTPAVVLPPAAPRQKGISTRKKYHAEVTNLRALIAGVHAGTVPILALQPNQRWLDQQAQSMQELFNIPGAKSVPENIIAVRAGKS